MFYVIALMIISLEIVSKTLGGTKGKSGFFVTLKSLRHGLLQINYIS